MARTSRNDSTRVREEFDRFLNKKNIGEQCTQESLIRLHEAFMLAENQEMNMPRLQRAFETILRIKMTDEDFQILFLKIDSKRDGLVTWDELISYLLLEFQHKDSSGQWQMLELPLSGLPRMLRTHHRSSVCRILFYPEVLPDRTTSFRRGRYLTVSRDGTINYWSLDLEYERGVRSTNPFLKVQPTVITDAIAMPDIQIVCTSSTERDLRFYDTVANKFDLRVLISSLENAVVTMYYHFGRDATEDSRVILGDTGGSVKIMTFSPIDKGPFKHKPDRDTIILRHEALARGELKGLKVVEIKNIHSNWVSQVCYYGSLRAFVSSSRCSDCSLLLSDPTETRIRYRFSVKMGISCFILCEESQMLVTGGPDCTVRIWNPFVPRKASMILQGHHATICALVIQNAGKRIYSLSKDRCIKVWDVGAAVCIQTYNALPSELSEYTPMTVVYNELTHNMIIASMMIAVLVCEQVIDRQVSDGFTHTRPVSCVLYNRLYQVIVTTGTDSCIIVWDPWRGRRLNLVRNAHSRLLYGEYVCVEITAACFDTTEQFLITGARDGSLKMWNFNTGTCIRHMALEDRNEVTSVSWLENRILCTGWNRRVTEFAVSETDVYRKSWETRHTDDVLCSSVRAPQALATASYNGELVLWRLETGRPYRIYQAWNPTGRYTIKYGKEIKGEHDVPVARTTEEPGRRRTSGSICESCHHQSSGTSATRVVPVRAVLFLNSRRVTPETGTLLVSLESGLIQVWTHHPAGSFLTAFSVIHSWNDCALSLATDPEDNFLVTGHRAGYIKVWLLTNYATPDPPKVCMPLLRLEFPFLWKDRINGRAKRAVRDQPLPLLLSSIQAHTGAVVSLQVIPRVRVVVSGSADRTVRLWTFGGRYISTLGTFREWSPILPTIPVLDYFRDYRLPPDIERSASFTTTKVLRGGLRLVQKKGEDQDSEMGKEVPEEERSLLYGRRLVPPILGNRFESPSRARGHDEPIALHTSLSYIPIYSHLATYPLRSIRLGELQSTPLKRD